MCDEYRFEVAMFRSAQLSLDSLEFLAQCELTDIVGVDVSWISTDHQYARPRHINVSNPLAKVGPCTLRASTADVKTHGSDVVAVVRGWTITGEPKDVQMDQDDVKHSVRSPERWCARSRATTWSSHHELATQLMRIRQAFGTDLLVRRGLWGLWGSSSWVADIRWVGL